MATKKITDLQLRDDVSEDLNFPSDDGIQSYRVTAVQVKEYVLAPGNITVAMLSQAVADLLVPPGLEAPYAGSTAPAGWLLAYGQAVSRATYSALFTAIGTQYGVGDGSTTFNIPDLRGRTIVGKDDMGGSAANRITAALSGIVGTTLGATGGAESHVLTTAQMPSHTHTQNPHDHDIVVHQGTSTPHAFVQGANTGASSTITQTTAIQNTTAVNQNTGGGGGHNNVQPSIIKNWIIKH